MQAAFLNVPHGVQAMFNHNVPASPGPWHHLFPEEVVWQAPPGYTILEQSLRLSAVKEAHPVDLLLMGF